MQTSSSRRPLSTDRNLARLLLLLALFLVIGRWLTGTRNFFEGIREWGLLMLAPSLAAIGVILFFLRRLKKLEFDENFLYIVSPKRTEIIPLENIQSLEVIRTNRKGQRVCRIRYTRPDGIAGSMRFVALNGTEPFRQILEKKNPGAGMLFEAGQ